MSYFLPPENVLMDCECQNDEVEGLDVAFSVCDHKDNEAST